MLVTNTRDFVLLGEDTQGRPATLETFRLAGSLPDFESKLQHSRAFARDVGATLGEYLSCALSHRAALTEPRDLAWLLASYARDGLARAEAAGDAQSLGAVRSALEEAWGTTDALVLAKTGDEPERTTSRKLQSLEGQDHNVRMAGLADRYDTRQGILNVDCFHLGICDPMDDTESRFRETGKYTDDSERLSAAAGRGS